MSTSDKHRLAPLAVAGGALDVEYVGQIDGLSYEEHLRSPEVQAVIERARAAWRLDQGNDPAEGRLGGLS
ncbi:MAG: hypothetical protein ACRDK4_05845 [Solirubrobacteraceae bacterium]